MLKAHSHENVIFTGVIDDISRAYSGGDIFFMPSHAETFGLVIVEALSSGLPVIARDIFEFREIFGNSVLFFREIGEARDLLNDDATLQRCASRARSSTEKYDITLIAKRHQQLYQELIEA
jgi:glycosyltransferase involved in cell wall biosynthesis